MNKNRDTSNIIKNALTSIIKHVSIIAFFVAASIILLLYLGPEINLNSEVIFSLAVPSVVLALSAIILYNLWVTNGQQNASSEDEYITLLTNYDVKSESLHYPTMQEFLEYEVKRRYNVAYTRLTRLIEREESLLEKLNSVTDRTYSDKLRIKFTNKRIVRYTKQRDYIKIVLPYDNAEEFDYLRYNTQDNVYKEYSPNDTKKHLRSVKLKKYIKTSTFTLVSFNILSIGGTMGNVWVAIIMTSLALVTLLTSVVTGFSAGYKNIKVISTGVYKTAISYIDQAVAFCQREQKDLYYKGTTQFKKYEPYIQDSIEPLDGSELYQDEVNLETNIFTKAEKEVTKTNLFGI